MNTLSEVPPATTFTVGDITVHRIAELVAPFLPALEMLPALTAEELDRHRQSQPLQNVDGTDCFVLTYQSFVVQTPDHTIVVDTCLGDHKDRPRPEWHQRTGAALLRGLSNIGLGVDDIDFVMCTHLHGDHIGWNTSLIDGKWSPTFPAARYIISRTEFEATEIAHREAALPHFADSVLPLFVTGQVDLVDIDFQIGDYVRLLSTPGHTAGHVAFCFGRGRDSVVMIGDLLHVPLQIQHPELSFCRDKDPDLAATSRRAVLARYCDTDTICCTGHLPAPSVGRIKRSGDGFRLVYDDNMISGKGQI